MWFWLHCLHPKIAEFGQIIVRKGCEVYLANRVKDRALAYRKLLAGIFAAVAVVCGASVSALGTFDPFMSENTPIKGIKVAELRVIGGVNDVAMLWSTATEGSPALTILDVEDPTANDALEVYFDRPLPSGDIEIKGATISALIKGEPLFSPLEGLPNVAWKGKTCVGCHAWDRANLCEQAERYTKASGEAALGKKHPYGGSFKRNLTHWANGGCQ